MNKHVHFVGIGGAGLSAIAKVLKERGAVVTGSDRSQSAYSLALESLGIPVAYSHHPENIRGADLLIVSSAVPPDNPEVLAAKQEGIPVLDRRSFFQELLQGKRTIAVAGTHGKTTTTGLIAWILESAGVEPGFIVGGILKDFKMNAKAGKGPLFVIEADEYERTFLGLEPELAVVTNVEHDHPDSYPTFDSFLQAFEDFVQGVQGGLVVCLDDQGSASLYPPAGVARITYGFSEDAEWRAEELRPNPAGGIDFLVLRRGEMQGLVRLRIPGRHNVLNSLGALACVSELGVDFTEARSALTEFHGVGRRFEEMGSVGKVTVIDDYAHHPTEIRATLAAAKGLYPDRELWAVYQPHTFSRTRMLFEPLTQAFSAADHVVVTPIFQAREEPDPEFSGRKLADHIQHEDVHYSVDFESAARHILGRLQEESLVVTLSAGDGNEVGKLVLEGLSTRGKGEEHG